MYIEGYYILIMPVPFNFKYYYQRCISENWFLINKKSIFIYQAFRLLFQTIIDLCSLKTKCYFPFWINPYDWHMYNFFYQNPHVKKNGCNVHLDYVHSFSKCRFSFMFSFNLSFSFLEVNSLLSLMGDLWLVVGLNLMIEGWKLRIGCWARLKIGNWFWWGLV